KENAVYFEICLGTSPYNWNTAATTVTTLSPVQTPCGLAFDSSNRLYIADGESSVIRRVDLSSGSVTDVAGAASNAGPGSTATALDSPADIYIDSSGNIYVLDTNNHRVQKFSSGATAGASGTTIAGTGEGGTNLNQLNYPSGFAFDSTATNMYITDTINHRIVQYSTSSTSGTNGVLVAGTGQLGNSLDTLNFPIGIAYDTSSGYLYIVNSGTYTIMKWFPGASSGTVAIGTIGTAAKTSALLMSPSIVKVDTNGNIYVVDNNRVMVFCQNNPTGIEIAGTTDVAGNAANELNTPSGLAFDSSMNIYVADTSNDRIQKFARS
ncbi:unnamed protein product, partial [Rotaria sp. Silwood1]